MVGEKTYNKPPPYRDVSPLDRSLEVGDCEPCEATKQYNPNAAGCISVGPQFGVGGYSPEFVPNLLPTPANPKTLMGRLKVAVLSVIPPVALVYLGLAMQDGARKYNPYNWRETKIETMVYVDAAMRHLMEWTDGQECAEDSGVPHLAHAMATIAILVDAIENDSVIDTRPKVGVVSKLLAKWKKAP